MLTLFSGFLILVGCNEYEINQTPQPVVVPPPEIVVNPGALTFSDLPSGETETQEFHVSNVGEGRLNVDGISIAVGDSFFLPVELGSFELEPGDSTTVAVTFDPQAGGANFGQVMVYSDDPVTPEVPVDLVGGGLMPQLAITPDLHEFGTTYIPCSSSVDLTMENVGYDTLVVDSLEYVSNGAMEMDHDLVFPLTLEPGETAPLSVTYTATEEALDIGQVVATSNDPAGVTTADQVGDGGYVDTGVTESHTVPTDPPVDIMFAVDQSCSMDTEANALASAFGSFISTIDTVTSGWQVGVLTLEDGCVNSIIDSSTPNYQSVFTNDVTVGGHHGLTEALLELSDKALGKTGAGACNAGLLRPGAMLHLIVVSDEPAQGSDTWQNYLASMSNVLSPGQTFPAGTPNPMLKVSAVVDLGSCGTGNAGYVDAANYTYGEILNICDSNWANNVGQLATASLSGINEFAVTGNPEAGSLKVYVDGVEWTGGWSWDAAASVVVFDDPQFEGGEVIDIEYDELSDCP